MAEKPSMPKSTINFDTLRDIGLTLPGVEESTAFGAPALKVRGKLLACVPTNRSAEADSLLVRMDFGERAELLQADPQVYYLPDHYGGYTGVLVRRIDREATSRTAYLHAGLREVTRQFEI